MFNKIFSLLEKTESKKGTSLPAGKELIGSMSPSMVGMMRKFAYQEAHASFPEKLFANPTEVIAAISSGSTEYGNWTKRTSRTGKAVYLTKYPDYPSQGGEVQAGVGAIIIDPSNPVTPEYFVLNVGSHFGPRVRRAFLDEDGSLCSAQDGPGCENSIEAFFQLLDSGKSGMEREREETRKRLEAQGVKFDDAE